MIDRTACCVNGTLFFVWVRWGIINAECQVMNGELWRVQRETDCHGRKRPRNDRVITECGGGRVDGQWASLRGAVGVKKGRVKTLPYGMKFRIYHSLVCRWGCVKKVLDFPTGGDSIAADTVCRSHHTAARCGDTLDGKCTVLPYSVVTASGAVVFSVRE